MYGAVKDELKATLAEIEEAGLYKRERELTTPQSSHVATSGGDVAELLRQQLPRLRRPPRRRRGEPGGVGRVGFRDGVGALHLRHPDPAHRASRRALSQFLGTEATILYSSCFDANGGVFEVLFGAEDAIVSDELNHASIIDGIRLSKAARFRYKNADMADLRRAARGGPGGGRPAGVRRHRRGVLDGRLVRPARRDLRPGRRVRGDGARRRLARRGVRRRRRPRHARAVRGDGPGRHRHRHARQGAGWRLGWLRREPPGGRRPAAPALAALPVLQLGRPGRRRRVARRPRPRVRARARRGRRCAATPPSSAS